MLRLAWLVDPFMMILLAQLAPDGSHLLTLRYEGTERHYGAGRAAFNQESLIFDVSLTLFMLRADVHVGKSFKGKTLRDWNQRITFNWSCPPSSNLWSFAFPVSPH